MLEMYVISMLPKEYFEKYLICSPLVESVSSFDIIGICHECLIYDSILFYEKKKLFAKWSFTVFKM